MIAVKDGVALLIDCKVLENKNGLFPLSRLEENQRLAAQKYIKCNNRWYMFAILWQDNVYMIPYSNFNFEEKSYELTDQIYFTSKFSDKMEKIYENKNR